jgi:tetratricopeptide (TPR) repeat protein
MAESQMAGRIAVDREHAPARTHAKPSVARTPAPEHPVEAQVRALQATAGNAAFGRFLQRAVAEDATGAASRPKPKAPGAILTFGSRGDDVSALQGRLNLLNDANAKLKVDGIFGRKTQAAVRAFQQAHPPLKVDGDAGSETRAEIDRIRSDPFELGQAHYAAGRYGRAYDEFSKEYETTRDPAVLFDRAQALRLMGGRRDEAIALYEQFAALDVAKDIKDRARGFISELRGPGRTGDDKADGDAADALYTKAAELYRGERYARAYDEFTKAYEATKDPAMLWDRAQALRLAGGRRAETIALYEQCLAAQIPDQQKVTARREIAELRGPGKTGDEVKDNEAVDALFKKAQELYQAESYARAYDEFSKAYEIGHDPAFLWNRAQSLRLAGGRRTEAMALYQQFIASDVPDEAKVSARVQLEGLRGPARPGALAGSGAPR